MSTISEAIMSVVDEINDKHPKFDDAQRVRRFVDKWSNTLNQFETVRPSDLLADMVKVNEQLAALKKGN
jgi:hypothetical protein